ncbi:MAG: hypothetical protein F6K36_23905 [Symploca sp. SIO3C6]|nr:hypothetical protein [Symploca sp. SIO3C6]
MVQWLQQLAPVQTLMGWQPDGNGTSQTRKWLGLSKNKEDKSLPIPETHANDGVAIGASHFIRWKDWQDVRRNVRGGYWDGEVEISDSPFVVVARPNIYRRQLHFENPDSKKPNPTQYRKRKGGTITPFGLRSGDFVEAEKALKIYRGWIGGYTKTSKTTNVSIYDVNWKRLGQFSPNKVKLLKRSTKLLIK